MGKAEIVDQTRILTANKPGPLATPEASKRSEDARRQKFIDRLAQSEEIAPGVNLAPDYPPGVGWTLKIPGRPKVYLATREQALEYYRNTLQRKDPRGTT